jgi:hypothetical protein
MAWLAMVWHLLGVLLTDAGSTSGLLVAGAVACGAALIAATLAAHVRRLRTTVTPFPGTAPAHRLHPARVPRHRDPDAAGHARPRAPGLG